MALVTATGLVVPTLSRIPTPVDSISELALLSFDTAATETEPPAERTVAPRSIHATVSLSTSVSTTRAAISIAEPDVLFAVLVPSVFDVACTTRAPEPIARFAPLRIFVSVSRVISITESVALIANAPPPATTVFGSAVVSSVAPRVNLLALTVVSPPAHVRVSPAIVPREVMLEIATRPPLSPSICGSAFDFEVA